VANDIDIDLWLAPRSARRFEWIIDYATQQQMVPPRICPSTSCFDDVTPPFRDRLRYLVGHRDEAGRAKRLRAGMRRPCPRCHMATQTDRRFFAHTLRGCEGALFASSCPSSFPDEERFVATASWLTNEALCLDLRRSPRGRRR
jgi:hypothetical protein